MTHRNLSFLVMGTLINIGHIKHFFVKWFHSWKELLHDRKFCISLGIGLAVLFVADVANYFVALYLNSIPVVSVGDIILDNIPTVDLTFMYTTGIYLVVILVAVYPIFFKPELFPFTIKTVAAFILIRSIFITLTHIGAPAGYFYLPQLDDQPGLFRFFYMNDLFFSGHTGFPFLAALLFWECKPLRYFLLAMSVAQATTVLFMHVHYSIDVFSAYFITYTIYVLSDKIFNNLNLSFRKIVQRIEERMEKMLMMRK